MKIKTAKTMLKRNGMVTLFFGTGEIRTVYSKVFLRRLFELEGVFGGITKIV